MDGFGGERPCCLVTPLFDKIAGQVAVVSECVLRREFQIRWDLNDQIGGTVARADLVLRRIPAVETEPFGFLYGPTDRHQARRLLVTLLVTFREAVFFYNLAITQPREAGVHP